MADPREQFVDQQEILRAAFEEQALGLWTALPCIVESYDPSAITITAQPAIKGGVRRPDGSVELVALPLLLDVPVHFPSGGGFTLTFPVKQGDEVLVVFASRCIDAWWQSGGVQPPAEHRMHDLSDGFAFPKVWSQPNRLSPAPHANNVQLRNDAATDYVEITPAGLMRLEAANVEVNARQKLRMTAEDIEVCAAKSYKLDIAGWGQRITWTGGSTWNTHTWQADATMTTTTDPINPPEGGL
jgi:hypothetical protein